MVSIIRGAYFRDIYVYIFMIQETILQKFEIKPQGIRGMMTIIRNDVPAEVKKILPFW